MALVCVADYEEKAKETIPKMAFDYYQSGAGDELTLKLNKTAFNRYSLYTYTYNTTYKSIIWLKY